MLYNSKTLRLRKKSTFVRLSNKRMKIAILGYGKMGKVIEKIALKRGHSILLKVNRENLDFDLKLLKNCDVAIEFSSPESAVNNINKCFDANVPVVVGTTGWYAEFNAVQERCISENKGLLHATNFSVGVNIFYEINKKLAALMDASNQYDVEIEELHHTQKLDAPSGTAITIAEGIIANLDRKVAWKNEVNVSENELAIESIRMEDVPGTHIVKYESDIDVIEIKHEDFFKTQKAGEDKLHMVFNPPYGERLDIDMEGFYKQIGDCLKQNYPNTDAWFITSNLEALKHVGLRPSRKIHLFNAKLEARLVKYEMYAGSKKGKYIK